MVKLILKASKRNEAFSMQQRAVKEVGEPQHQSEPPARRARGEDGVVAAAGDRGAVDLHTRGRGQGERSPGTGVYYSIIWRELINKLSFKPISIVIKYFKTIFNFSFPISEEGESGVGDSEEAGEALQGDGGRGEGHEGVGVREPEEPGREDEQGGAHNVGEGAEQEAVQRARAQDGRDARGHQVNAT